MTDYDEINEITDMSEDSEKKDKVCLTKSDFAKMVLVFTKIAILVLILVGCLFAMKIIFGFFAFIFFICVLRCEKFRITTKIYAFIYSVVLTMALDCELWLYLIISGIGLTIYGLLSQNDIKYYNEKSSQSAEKQLHEKE